VREGSKVGGKNRDGEEDRGVRSVTECRIGKESM